jgi:hypothetical protein
MLVTEVETLLGQGAAIYFAVAEEMGRPGSLFGLPLHVCDMPPGTLMVRSART